MKMEVGKQEVGSGNGRVTILYFQRCLRVGGCVGRGFWLSVRSPFKSEEKHIPGYLLESSRV